MQARFTGALKGCCLVVCLTGVFSAGCDDDEDRSDSGGGTSSSGSGGSQNGGGDTGSGGDQNGGSQNGGGDTGNGGDGGNGSSGSPLTDFERGTIAQTRWEACGVEPWKGLDVRDSLSIEVTTFPENIGKGADCVVAAKDCSEVWACTKYFLLSEELDRFPECGSDRTGYCEDNVAKYCKTQDNVTWYEVSYDCTLAGASCVEGGGDGEEPWSDCVLPDDLCEGEVDSYCDGTTAVVCSPIHKDYVSAAVFDCAKAFDSTCVEVNTGADCEGPNLTEGNCRDEEDNDNDGDIDCDDSDCASECAEP